MGCHGVICPDDLSVGCGAPACFHPDVRERELVWLVAGCDSVVDERHGGRGGLLLDCSVAWARSGREAVFENGTCDHRAVFRAAWRPKRAHRAPAPVRLVRLRELLRRLDLDVFQGLYDCDGHRAASGDDCVLLCGRYAHWWCKDAGHGPVHSLCARGARCFGAAALPRACITRQGGGRRGDDGAWSGCGVEEACADEAASAQEGREPWRWA